GRGRRDGCARRQGRRLAGRCHQPVGRFAPARDQPTGRSEDRPLGRRTSPGCRVRSTASAIGQGGTQMKQLWDRWGPLTGLLSVGCSVVGTLFVLNQPQDKDSDSKIVAYFAEHSHQVRGVVGFFVFLAGIVLLLVFLAALRERLLAA